MLCRSDHIRPLLSLLFPRLSIPLLAPKRRSFSFLYFLSASERSQPFQFVPRRQRVQSQTSFCQKRARERVGIRRYNPAIDDREKKGKCLSFCVCQRHFYWSGIRVNRRRLWMTSFELCAARTFELWEDKSRATVSWAQSTQLSLYLDFVWKDKEEKRASYPVVKGTCPCTQTNKRHSLCPYVPPQKKAKVSSLCRE